MMVVVNDIAPHAAETWDARDPIDAAAATSGDHEAFARLYDRHAPVVLSLCRRIGALAEAEDATQETFMRAHRMLDRLHDARGFRPWLYAIARRVCSERRRSRTRRSRHEDRAMSFEHVNGTPPVAAPAAVAQAEALDRLTEALEQLDERERLAIHLSYLEADPVRAGAAALGLSRSGYYKLLARARDRLAGLMRELQPS
jgi:RNA polymerase sigma-70 factor (ECF subfamily)